MRIAVIVKSLQVGGMERAAINLAETFANEEHETHLIYFKSKSNELSVNENVTTHLFELEKILKISLFGFFFNILAKLINGFIRYSYFYFQGLMLAPIFRYKLSQLEKQYGKLDLIIVRGQGTFEMIWPYNDPRLIIQQVNVLRVYKSIFNNFFQRTIFNHKQVVCNAPTVFEELTHDFEHNGVAVKSLQVIPSPINTTSVKLKSDAYDPQYPHRYIINVGRLVPVKNLSLLLDAYAYAKEHLGLTHHLVIVGDGNLKPSLEQQAKELNIAEFVHFTGSISNPYPWLKYAELFVFTSKNEGLPNVLLEALACDTPIVSTRGRGGTLDIMSDGLEENLTNFDAAELAQKMVDVLHSKEPIDFKKHLLKYEPASVVQEYLKYIKKA